MRPPTHDEAYAPRTRADARPIHQQISAASPTKSDRPHSNTGLDVQKPSHANHEDDWRIERLIGHLPLRLSTAVCWLRRPGLIWMRVSAGILLICGGVLGFLPVLGFWMLPLGAILLADDVPALRSLRSWMLDWIERRHPNWLAD